MATAVESKIWTTRNYILAALGGTLAATAVVIVVSIVLRPADISFSIVHASNRNVSAFNSIFIQRLDLTIAASNASQKRAAVRYQSIFVGLQNSTDRRSTMNVKVYARPNPGEYLPPGAPQAIIKASTRFELFGHYLDLVGNTGLTVVVEAQVRFRVGGIPTRLYDIKVYCPIGEPSVHCGA